MKYAFSSLSAMAEHLRKISGQHMQSQAGAKTIRDGHFWRGKSIAYDEVATLIQNSSIGPLSYTPEQVADLRRYVGAGSSDYDVTEQQHARWHDVVEVAICAVSDGDYDPMNPSELLYDADEAFRERVIAYVIAQREFAVSLERSDFTHVFRATSLTAAYYVVTRTSKLYIAWFWGDDQNTRLEEPPTKLHQAGWRFESVGEAFRPYPAEEEER